MAVAITHILAIRTKRLQVAVTPRKVLLLGGKKAVGQPMISQKAVFSWAIAGSRD